MAYSGGRDSTALLFATLKSARQQGVRVAALHVHHGLSPFADDWLAHCEQQCHAWARKGYAVDFISKRLNLRVARGESIEAVARDARYAALTDMAREAGATLVLLGQHRRDQAETFLLQALRGAGVAGLAGMPARFDRDGITWARPWLTKPREVVEAYLRRHRLTFVDDDSNSDPRYARNRLRLQVWPALVQAFPDGESVLSDSATWAAEADAVLREVAQQDWAALNAEQGGAAGLPIEGLQCLSPHRARNVLRFWFQSQAGMVMPASLLERVVSEWRVSGAASWSAPHGAVRCYRGRLRYEATPLSVASPQAAPRERAPTLSIKRAGCYALPGWGGVLQVKRTQACGLPLADAALLRLEQRGGGEQFQLALNRPPRSLKKQFQVQAVPAWERDGPLLYCGDRLVFVPGLGVDARAWAPSGEPQFSLTWLPNGRE